MNAMSLRWVVLGGLLAGALDILFAIAFWAVKADVPAARILQSVAAGLLGPASFKGGSQTAILGLALHFSIAMSMSVVYFAAAKQWRELVRRPLLYGSIYGVLLYLTMNFVVVPMSAAQPGSRDSLWVVLSILAHMLFVGIPITMCVRQALTCRAS